MRFRQIAALMVAAGLAFAACGDSETEEATDETSTEVEESEDSMEESEEATDETSTEVEESEDSMEESEEAIEEEETEPVADLDTKTIAISFPNGFKQDAVIKEFDAAEIKAAEMGYELIIDDPGEDLAKQINVMETWIEQGVGTIIAQPLAPETVEAVAEKARAKGIKWITYANAIENQDATLGFDHIAGGTSIGAEACEWALEALDGEAKVAILTYEPGGWAQLRREGIETGLASCGATMEIVSRQDALSQTEGLNAMNAILQAEPEVNVVLAVVDTATEGAFQAYVNGGRAEDDATVFLAGIDGSLRSLELIKQGSMYRASAALNLIEVGDGMVLLPDQLWSGTEGDYLVPLELVTVDTPDLLDSYIELLG